MKAPRAPAPAPDSRLPPWKEVIPRASQQEQDPSLTPFITPWQMSPTESPFCRPRSPSLRPTNQSACRAPLQCLWQEPRERSSPCSCRRVLTTSRGLVKTQATQQATAPSTKSKGGHMAGGGNEGPNAPCGMVDIAGGILCGDWAPKTVSSCEGSRNRALVIPDKPCGLFFQLVGEVSICGVWYGNHSSKLMASCLHVVPLTLFCHLRGTSGRQLYIHHLQENRSL